MDAADLVIVDMKTDANGNVAGDLPGGGSVTVLQDTIDANGSHREQLATFRGVKPGDVLQAGGPHDPANRSGHTNLMTAVMPLDAYNGQLYFECGGATSDLPPNGREFFTFYDSCATPTFDVLMLVDMSGTLEYVWQPGQTFVPDGEITMGDNLALLAQSSTQVANVPANLTRIAAWEYTLLGSSMLELDQKSVELPPAGTSSVSLRYPPGAGDGTLIYVAEVTGIDLPQLFAVMTFGSVGDVGFDLASQPLPSIPAKPTQTAGGVSWTESGTGSPDARYVLWVGSWTDPASVPHTAAWTIVEDPAGAPSSQLVPLPSAYANDDPTKATVTLLGSHVTYVDYDNLAGYDAARPYGPMLADVTRALRTVEHHAHASQSR